MPTQRIIVSLINNKNFIMYKLTFIKFFSISTIFPVQFLALTQEENL